MASFKKINKHVHSKLKNDISRRFIFFGTRLHSLKSTLTPGNVEVEMVRAREFIYGGARQTSATAGASGTIHNRSIQHQIK